MAEGAGEEQEAMLERLLTRLALTDDSKLEPVLAKLLPYSISCLASGQQSIKQKVMDILTHINKRVKDQPSIKLPLHELLRLYQDEKAEPMVKSFALVYMEMAFDRHSKDESDLVPELIRNISKLSVQHQDILLRMAAKGLEKYASKIPDEGCAARYTFLTNAADRDIFLEFCLQTILYQPFGSLLGLSKLQALRVSGKLPLRGESLLNRKMGMLNLLSELQLPEESIYALLIVASVDSNDRVTKRADELSKKKAAGVNLEDPTLMKKLFSLFQGTIGDNITEDVRVPPASPPIREKLLGVFTRSILAANSFPATLHCIFSCIFGNESFSRLKQAGMEFTVWVFKHAREDQIKLMAPIILSGILKLLDNPAPSEADTAAKQLRSFAYQAIGQLGKRAPYLFRDNTDIVLRLFEAIKVEPLSMRFTVQEALTSLASAYKTCSEAVEKEIVSLLLRNIYAVEGEARFCSVWWAKNLYSSTHCASRFICMVGTSDERLDVRDIALEGLNHEGDKKIDYPPLSSMLDFICNQQPKLLIPSKLGEQELLFNSRTYEAMVIFLLGCTEFNSPFEGRFVLLLEHGMASSGNIDLHITAANGLLRAASATPQKFSEFYIERINWLRQFLGHIAPSVRETIAKLLGIVASGLPVSTTEGLLKDLREFLHPGSKSRFEDVHGAICATGYILAECLIHVPPVQQDFVEMITSSLVKVGHSGSSETAGAVVEAIGHIGLRFPVITAENNKQGTAKSCEANPGFSTDTKMASNMAIGSSARKLLRNVISSNDTKAIQKAAIAYGHVCFGDLDEELAKEALNALLGLCRSKVEDVLFSVGEALCFIWDGLPVTADEILKTTFVSLSNASKFLNDQVEGSDKAKESLRATDLTNDEKRDKARDIIVQKLFDDLLFSSRKEERCAGAVWLVSLITYCGKHPRLQRMLPEIQEALSHLLGDQNDLTQEMASKGMSILYELGDPTSRDELVKVLVGTLSGTAKRKRAIKLTEDTEVFEEGALGEKPGGGNITTYKELCSLANEMGQPDLIYKFMDLANHQASLNSKRGAAFGFARIAKQARDALCPYLPVLIPKLIRYQYDPNKSVQDAMGHIWRSMVSEPKKTIDEFFDVIMKDLLSQAGSRLWRSRESSCLALADILQGRRFQEVNPYLEQTWTACFRAMDDVKETVRTSGIALSRSISSLTLRLADTQLTAQSEARMTVNIVLPVLLSKGVVSNIAEVQRVSINTVMKLSKSAGKSLRPQLPDLTVCMLESLSSLEDQRLNYAELHAENAGISTEKLESLRVAVARDSPMWETLDYCLQQVDGEVMEVLVPRMIQLVRTGVGLNTRVGVAKFIGLLTQKQGIDMKQHAGQLLKVLKKVAQEERSPAARRAFASACAAVAKYAGPSQIQGLFQDIVELYSANASNGKIASALLLRELSSEAGDVFVGFHSLVMPLAFIARFDEDKAISGIFADIWEQNTSGEGVALQLYASDIVALALKGLSDKSWMEKKKCAMAIAKLANASGASTVPYVQPLLKTILGELPSRLWEGKEVLLDALTAICKNCSESIPKASTDDVVSRRTVVNAVIAACSKKKSTFRNSALYCLEQILLHFRDEALSETALIFLLQCGNSVEKADGESGTDDTGMLSLEKVLLCMNACIASVSMSAVHNKLEVIAACLVEKVNGTHTWQVKLAALANIQALAERLSSDTCSGQEECNIIKWLEALLLAMLEGFSSMKVGQVRMACLEGMLRMLGLPCFGPQLVKGMGEAVSNRMLYWCELEKTPAMLALMQKVLAVVQSNMDVART